MREIIFCKYNESSVTDPSVYDHKITDTLISAKLDSAKITGIDYHKQESRNMKIEFLNDESEFVQSNLINQIKKIPSPVNIENPFFYYLVRLLEDGQIIFTGWIKRTSIKYDIKSDKFQMIASDVISVLVEEGKRTTTLLSDVVYDIDTLLMLKLNILIGSSSFEIPRNYNYIKDTGIWQEGMNILIQDSDFGANWANFHDTAGNWWHYPLAWYDQGYFGSGYSSVSNSHNVLALRLDPSDNKPQLVMMRYYKAKYKQRFSWEDDFNYYVKENLLLKTCKFDNLFSPYDFYSHSFENETYCPTEATQTTAYSSEQLYQNYVDMGLPTDNTLSITGFDEYDSSIYFDSLTEDPVTIKYTGYMVFDLITIKQGTYSHIDILKMILTINNLTIKSYKTGAIEIINKNYSTGNTSISDADIIEFSQSAVKSSEIDYSTILTPLSENIDSITNALSEYYAEAIPDYEYSLEILNNYELKLNDKINVLNKEMYIVDIGIDKDNFIYKIKAWSV